MIKSVGSNNELQQSSNSGSSHTVKSGDTMWAIAQKNGVSLNQLIKANPQIKNPNLIFPGQQISIPGGSSSGSMGGLKVSSGSSPSERPPQLNSMGGVNGTSSGGDSSALNVARSVLGRNISDLKYNGPLAANLDKWPGNNVCCANFVSACLEKAGQISHSQHNDSVKGLAANLRNDPQWAQTSLKDAKPGDVVCFNVPGEGPMSHVVMFAGWKNGQPTFIGSNNVNRDGSQRITEGSMGYPVGAVFSYRG
jgi:spore coat assembly protein SafA